MKWRELTKKIAEMAEIVGWTTRDIGDIGYFCVAW